MCDFIKETLTQFFGTENNELQIKYLSQACRKRGGHIIPTHYHMPRPRIFRPCNGPVNYIEL